MIDIELDAVLDEALSIKRDEITQAKLQELLEKISKCGHNRMIELYKANKKPQPKIAMDMTNENSFKTGEKIKTCRTYAYRELTDKNVIGKYIQQAFKNLNEDKGKLLSLCGPFYKNLKSVKIVKCNLNGDGSKTNSYVIFIDWKNLECK